MAQTRIDGPVHGRYEAVITANPFEGTLRGRIDGEFNGRFRGEGEIRTPAGYERIDGERQLKGQVEGRVQGEFSGELHMRFEGYLDGEMAGVIER